MVRVVRWTVEELRQRERDLQDTIREWIPLHELEQELEGVQFLLGNGTCEDTERPVTHVVE